VLLLRGAIIGKLPGARFGNECRALELRKFLPMTVDFAVPRSINS